MAGVIIDCVTPSSTVPTGARSGFRNAATGSTAGGGGDGLAIGMSAANAAPDIAMERAIAPETSVGLI